MSIPEIQGHLVTLARQNVMIAAQLRQLQFLLQPLGFIQVGAPVVVFCNLTKGNGDGWYRLNEAGMAVTLPPTFWGRVDDLRFFTTETRSRNSAKLRLHMKGAGGQLYYFESGNSAYFARTVMAALSKADVAQLQQAICIKSWIKEIEQGQNAGDKTLAVSLSLADGTRLDCGWKGDDDWRAIAAQAKHHVYLATGKEAQGNG